MIAAGALRLLAPMRAPDRRRTHLDRDENGGAPSPVVPVSRWTQGPALASIAELAIGSDDDLAERLCGYARNRSRQ